MIARTATPLVLLAPLPLAQSLHVVDDDGGADFVEISEAIAAASSGDALLVRDGTYGAFTVDGLSLVIHADVGAVVQVGEECAIRNVEAGGSVLVAGLEFNTAGSNAVVVEACAGSVWFQDCALRAGAATPFGTAHGALVEGSANTVFTGCTLLGGFFRGFGIPLVGIPGDGLVAVDSTVHLFDSECRGGPGPVTTPGTLVFAGGDGAVLIDSTLFASGSVIRGGDGDPGGPSGFFLPPCNNGGAAGDGLVLGGASTARLLDTLTIAGVGGSSSHASCVPGEDGEALVHPTGTVVSLPGTAPGLEVPSPLREGESATLRVDGAPGELAWLMVSLDSATSFDPFLSGTLNLGLPIYFVFLGVADASGEVPLDYTLGDFQNPAREFVQVFEQGFHFDAQTGVARRGSVRAAMHVDAAF